MTCEDCKFYENECDTHFHQELMGQKRSLEICEIFYPKIRYIDGNALIDDLQAAKNNGGMGAVVASTLIRYVKRCPTLDAVEVIRCKDCKNWMYEYDDVGLCVTDVPDIDGVQRLAHDFCSYGERKTDV